MPKLTGQVAQEVGVTRQTIRTWATRFPEWLSPEASQPGQTRYFSEADIEVLTAIKAFRDLNLTYDEIADKLRSGAHLTMAAEEAPAQEPPSGEPITTALITMDQVQAMMRPLAAATEEWRAIAEERRQELESLREENRRLREQLGQRHKSWLSRLLGR